MGEQAWVAAHRNEPLARVAGRVVEVDAGSGLCFGHYPDNVTEVVAAEPEPYLHHLAEHAAAAAPVPVRVIDSGAERLPFDDHSFDVVVASLVLCSVPDQSKALAPRRPAAILRTRPLRRPPPSPPARPRREDLAHLLGGCHANRDTPTAITQAGFGIKACQRFEFRLGALSAPASPHVIGVAARTSRELPPTRIKS